ncbi:HD domain-containing protein [Microtetraspora niveoalba]|uniref:HD domain-containing protein n=1 Tax=Microtetraspora niveoalba TaxID=46175 RepID=UPI000A0418EE|nr:HD domain-containing protein [Microtetraspora niveoalba]
MEIDKLKRVIRRNTLIDGSRRENGAEHSWHVGMLAMTMGEHAPPGTDLERVVAMLLVHDIVEIDTGDCFRHDLPRSARPDPSPDGPGPEALAAADRIFDLLPDDQRVRLRSLWDEFEERRTPEARFARALDRLVPIMANHHNEGGTWTLYKVTARHLADSVRIIAEGSATLGAYAARMVESSVARGHLAP